MSTKYDNALLELQKRLRALEEQIARFEEILKAPERLKQLQAERESIVKEIRKIEDEKNKFLKQKQAEFDEKASEVETLSSEILNLARQLLERVEKYPVVFDQAVKLKSELENLGLKPREIKSLKWFFFAPGTTTGWVKIEAALPIKDLRNLLRHLVESNSENGRPPPYYM